MNSRPLTSWLGLVLLATGAFVIPCLRWASPVAEAQTGCINLTQGIRGSSPEPPLAPGMATPFVPQRPGRTVPAVAGDPSDPPTPQVTIRVRVPALANPNQELEYRIVVQNVSQAPAHHVRVRAPLPSNSTLVGAKPDPEPATTSGQMIWELKTLAGGESRQISLIVKPTGTGDLSCCARVQFEHGECVRTRLTQPDLRLQFRGPAQALLHDIVSMQLDVTNVGQREARGVVLSNLLPDGFQFVNSKPSTNGNNPLTWDLGSIASGKSKRVEYEVTAGKTGTLLNKAEVRDAAGAKQETSVQVVVGEPKLSVAIVGPHRRVVGRPTTYQITVSNPGTSPATHVELHNKVPNDVTFVSATVGGQLQGDTVRWKMGTLAPGAKQVVQLTLKATKPGKLDNGAIATADRDLNANAKCVTAFHGDTGLTLEIDKKPDPLEVGRTGTYTLHVINQGSLPATKLFLTLTMPDELKVIEKGGGIQEGPKLSFALGDLAPGGETKVTITAEALRSADARLRAELTADDLTSGPIRFEERATLYSDNPLPAPGG